MLFQNMHTVPNLITAEGKINLLIKAEGKIIF